MAYNKECTLDEIKKALDLPKLIRFYSKTHPTRPIDKVRGLCEEYVKFLYLKAIKIDKDGTLLIPSADVESVWRQHLLDTISYFNVCETVGFIIEHDPEREEDAPNVKAERFVRTVHAYQEVFGNDMAEDCWSGMVVCNKQKETSSLSSLSSEQHQKKKRKSLNISTPLSVTEEKISAAAIGRRAESLSIPAPSSYKENQIKPRDVIMGRGNSCKIPHSGNVAFMKFILQYKTVFQTLKKGPRPSRSFSSSDNNNNNKVNVTKMALKERLYNAWHEISGRILKVKVVSGRKIYYDAPRSECLDKIGELLRRKDEPIQSKEAANSCVASIVQEAIHAMGVSEGKISCAAEVCEQQFVAQNDNASSVPISQNEETKVKISSSEIVPV